MNAYCTCLKEILLVGSKNMFYWEKNSSDIKNSGASVSAKALTDWSLCRPYGTFPFLLRWQPPVLTIFCSVTKSQMLIKVSAIGIEPNSLPPRFAYSPIAVLTIG